MIDQTHDFGLTEGETYEPPEIEENVDLTQPHVMTALGPIEPGALGLTLHHEHVICKPANVDEPDLMLDEPVAALAELEDAFQVGLRSIVDMTPADYGRDLRDIVWVARRAPVHIILITGHHKHKYAAPYLGDASAETIADSIIMELTSGIDGAQTRAGVIKAGTSLSEITEIEQRVLEAAAIAHRATGAPISTHTERGTMAPEQIEVLSNAGVDPARIVIGHMDFALDERYLLKALETGVFVSFDQVSKTKYAADADRAAMLKRLIDAGHLSQLLVSGDLARRSYYLAHGGRPGLRYLVERFSLVLMEAGLTAEQVRSIYIDNPARALTITPPGS
jgi:phosphotriesterase-related protein